MDVNRLIDGLPYLRRLAQGDFGAGIRQGIVRLFPARTSAEHEAILRGYLRYRLLNRIIYRLTMLLPKAAAMASGWIPIVGKSRMLRANEHCGPIIVASAHFGSLFFLIFVIARALPGRRIYVMHKKTVADSARDEAFLRRHGFVPVGGDERGLLTLVRALQNDPNAAVMLAFDPPMGNRHIVPFLATRLPVSMGVGVLADIGRCPVVPWFWQYDGIRPSLFVNEPIFADPRLPVSERRIAVVEALYALLEQRVAQHPEQWHLTFMNQGASFEAAPVGILP